MSWNTDQYYSDIVRYGAPIWDNIYQVSMATRNVQSTEQLRHFGLPSVGDPRLDALMHNEHTTVMLTIDAIFEKYRAGIPVHFIHNPDVERIYDIVYNYLSAWERQLAHGINIGGAPVEDLVDLDAFAAKLYTQSRMFNGARQRGDLSFIESLKKAGGFGVIGGKTAATATPAPKAGAQKADTHFSFADAFSAARFLRGKKRDEDAPTSLPTSDRWGS